MDKNDFVSIIVGFLLGFGVSYLCTGRNSGGITGSEELYKASDTAKQQFAEHHRSATEGSSRVENYNIQLGIGQTELGDSLREADRRIENAIKYYEEKIKREQSTGGRR